MSTNKNVKKPKDDSFIEIADDKNSIILLGVGIVIVFCLIIGLVLFLDNKKVSEEEKEKKEEPKIKEIIDNNEEEEKENTVVKTSAVRTNYQSETVKYKVNFYYNNELVNSTEVVSGGNVTKYELVLENKVLKYWYYIDEANNKVIFDFTGDTVGENLDLFANVVNLYDVTFNNALDEEIANMQTVEENSLIEEPDDERMILENGNIQNKFTKVVHWYLDKNFTDEFDITVDTILNDTVLYGKYEDVVRIDFYTEFVEDYTNYNLEYISKYIPVNSKTAMVEGLKYGEKSLIGWLNVTDDSEVNDETVFTKNEALKPKFGYILSYDTNGGNEIESIGLLEGETLVSPVIPVKQGYAFNKWVNISEEEITFTEEITKDTTIYARWTAAVDFETYGGTKVSPIVPEENGKILVVPRDPIKAGYTFEGWFYDEEFTESADLANDVFIVPEVVYAKFTANENILTISTNTGVNVDILDNGNNKTYSLKTDEIITLPDLTDIYTKTGFVLVGYSTTANGEVEYELGEEYKMGTSNTVLYAVWKQVFTVTLDLNGGSVNGSEKDVLIEKVDGDELGDFDFEIDAPTEGEVIEELNTLSNGTGIEITGDTVINSNMTVHVLWTSPTT